jgi:hypothetical protein
MSDDNRGGEAFLYVNFLTSALPLESAYKGSSFDINDFYLRQLIEVDLLQSYTNTWRSHKIEYRKLQSDRKQRGEAGANRNR